MEMGKGQQKYLDLLERAVVWKHLGTLLAKRSRGWGCSCFAAYASLESWFGGTSLGRIHKQRRCTARWSSVSSASQSSIHTTLE